MVVKLHGHTFIVAAYLGVNALVSAPGVKSKLWVPLHKISERVRNHKLRMFVSSGIRPSGLRRGQLNHRYDPVLIHQGLV